MIHSNLSRSPEPDTVSVLVVGDFIALYRTLERTAPEGEYTLELLGFAERKLPQVATPPDLILIDLADEDDVISLLKRARVVYPDAKVILITRHDSPDWLQNVSQLGVSYCIMRPVDAKTVVRRIIQVARPESHRADVRLGKLRRINWEREVSALLTELGVPVHYKGYAYLTTAIAIAVQDSSVLGRITSSLYPQVAKVHGVTPVHVERSIRHAIEVTWMRGNMALINSLFAYSISQDKGKPTNGLFIARLTDYLRLDRNVPTA